MEIEQIKKVMDILIDAQATCAPIHLQIGYTDAKQFVHNHEIVITKCPPSVTKKLHEAGYSLGVRNNGVLLEYLK